MEIVCIGTFHIAYWSNIKIEHLLSHYSYFVNYHCCHKSFSENYTVWNWFMLYLLSFFKGIRKDAEIYCPYILLQCIQPPCKLWQQRKQPIMGAIKMSTNVPGSRYRFGTENFAGTKIFIGSGNVSWTQYRNARFTTETRHCLDSLLSLLWKS